MNEELERPEEFNHVYKVLEEGAKKYGPNSWLHGIHWDHKSNHASMSRHLAEAYMLKRKDDDSGLNPLLHLAARALMAYTLQEREEQFKLKKLAELSEPKRFKQAMQYHPVRDKKA